MNRALVPHKTSPPSGGHTFMDIAARNMPRQSNMTDSPSAREGFMLMIVIQTFEISSDWCAVGGL